MTAAQYKETLDKLRLSQSEAARFLGVAVSTSHRWAKGTAPVPKAVALCLRFMTEEGIDPKQIKPAARRG
jgi:DNA-binding transcriptional regulator YiaG